MEIWWTWSSRFLSFNNEKGYIFTIFLKKKRNNTTHDLSEIWTNFVLIPLTLLRNRIQSRKKKGQDKNHIMKITMMMRWGGWRLYDPPHHHLTPKKNLVPHFMSLLNVHQPLPFHNDYYSLNYKVLAI